MSTKNPSTQLSKHKSPWQSETVSKVNEGWSQTVSCICEEMVSDTNILKQFKPRLVKASFFSDLCLINKSFDKNSWLDKPSKGKRISGNRFIFVEFVWREMLEQNAGILCNFRLYERLSELYSSNESFWLLKPLH